MKNMTPEEMKKLYEALQEEMDKQTLNGNWRSLSTASSNTPIPPYVSFPPLPSMSISPTDIDARGRYAYQEPEVDEQGTYYGYKVLHKCMNSGCRRSGGLISPRYQEHWSENGELRADKVPAENHMHGIHFTKRPDHPELRNYKSDSYGFNPSYSYYEYKGGSSVLVKCSLSGTIVETEQGFRAEHAQIIGVFINGDWQSYQDYQERARAYSRPIPEETEWKVNYRLTYGKPTKGNWTAYTDFSADP